MARQTGPKRKRGETRALVAKLHAENLTGAQIAQRLGINRATVVYHLARLGQPIDERFARRYNWDEIRATYEAGSSARQCRERFGFTRAAWADAVRRGDIVVRPRAMPIHELLVVGRRTSRGHLKLRLLAEGLKENRCEVCGIDAWLGRPLSMALHQINGDGRDNRLANLQFLCPNCHSQTDTFGGRNGHRRRRPA